MNAAALAGSPVPTTAPYSSRLSHVGLLARGDTALHRCLDAVLALADPEAGLPACFDLFAESAGLIEPAMLDLVMLCRRPVDRMTPQQLSCCSELLHAGPAVFFLPYQPARIAKKRVLIIWDGSRSATAAAHAALPMLGAAAEIMLLDARCEAACPAFERIEALVRNGAPQAKLDTTRIELGSAASVVETAIFTRADYVVMGGRGRWNALPEILYGDIETPFLRSRIPFLLGQ